MKVEDISIAELPDECDWPLHSTRARYFSRISHQGNTLRRVGHARETKGEDPACTGACLILFFVSSLHRSLLVTKAPHCTLRPSDAIAR